MNNEELISSLRAETAALRERVETLEEQQSLSEEDLHDIYRLTKDVCPNPEAGAEAVARLVDDRDALRERLERSLLGLLDLVTGHGERPPALYNVEERIRELLSTTPAQPGRVDGGGRGER